MSLRVILLPLKAVVLMAMIFVPLEQVLQLAGVLLILVIIPKVGTMVDLVLHSGYFRSPQGEVYKVDKIEREGAISRGFQEVSLFTSASLQGKIEEYHSDESGVKDLTGES